MRCTILIAIFCFSAITNAKERSITGKWNCEQSSQISSSIEGINAYRVEYSSKNSSAIQKGSAIVKDNANSTMSKLNYTIEFIFESDDKAFTSTVRKIDFEVEYDELSIFNDPATGFPKVNERVSGKWVFITESETRAIFSDGTYIDCKKERT